MKRYCALFALFLVGACASTPRLKPASGPADLHGKHLWEIRREFSGFIRGSLPDAVTEELKRKARRIQISKLKEVGRRPEAHFGSSWEYDALVDQHGRLWLIVMETGEELGMDVIMALFDRYLRLHDSWLAGHHGLPYVPLR